MRKNLISRAIALVALTLNSLFVFSQPLITALSPSKMYTQNESEVQGWGGSQIELAIIGKNFETDTITGYNFNDRVKLYFKKGDKLERITVNSGGADALYVTMFTSDWLRDVTPVGIYVEVDGVRSNTFYFQVIEIPRIPPVITTTGPISYTINKERKIHISGKFLGELRTTKVLVNGIECTIARTDDLASYINFLIPASIAETPGTYSIVVHSIFGNSNPVSLVVQKPLIQMVVPKVQATIAPNLKPLPKEAEVKKKQ